MDYSKYATVARTSSGSWAAHVINRVTHKKMLLGTFNTEDDARRAVDAYAHPEKNTPKAESSEKVAAMKQVGLFGETHDDA